MGESPEFDFGSSSIATAYDSALVPVLFRPWAELLAAQHSAWAGLRVLDLATGTGVMAEVLAEEVGLQGEVIGADISSEMLSLARRRCADLEAVRFVESAAHPLELESGAVDFAVCQQGFQFFPDRDAAAGELHRVLGSGGRVIVATWCPVAECELFGVICDALITIQEDELAGLMRVPFDHLSASELMEHFAQAGFENVTVEKHEMDLVLEGGIEHALDVANATPIGPQLSKLPDAKQEAFREAMLEFVEELSEDGVTMGRMVSNVLSAER
jgi:ubiquinone/menaquinone biosynthesis C-methylase UbiE